MSEEETVATVETDTATPETETTETTKAPDNSMWYDTLPEQIKETGSIKKYKTLEAAAQGFINAQSMVGADKIQVPKTEEQFLETYRKLGSPETAEGYKLEVPDNLDGNVINAYKGVCAETGISQAQAEKMFNWYSGVMKEGQDTFEQERTVYRENAEAELKKELGNAYEGSIKKVQMLFNKYGDEQSKEELETSGLGNNPALIKMFLNMSKSIGEEGLVVNEGNTGRTPSQIKEDIANIKADEAYLDGSNPRHKVISEKMRNLYKELNGMV